MSLPSDGITVREIQCSNQGDLHLVSASIDVGADSHKVWYRFSEASTGQETEALLAATLQPAMKLGRPLRISGAISPRLSNAVPTIQQIFRSWDNKCHTVPVEAELREQAVFRARESAACFFSGGVDSFYTLLKRRDQISKIIFVHGFDIPLAALRFRAKVSDAIRFAAADLKKPLIEVETNLRDFSDHYVSFDHYDGAALASVALLLSDQFSHVYAAATHAFAAPFPWRYHLNLDPLWSTEGMEILNDDGHEVSRVAKVAYISRYEVALRSLRVCGENRGDAYNCGECEKCLRTMVALRIAGALDRCTTFARPLDLTSVSRLVPGRNRYFIEENFHAAVRSGTDPALVEALRDCLAGRYYRNRGTLIRGARRRARRLVEGLAGRIRKPTPPPPA